MTQQYIVGELSSLLAELDPAPAGPVGAALAELRHEVECSSAQRLEELSLAALDLVDGACWASLDLGDVGCFSRCAATVATLREFMTSAGLLP